MRDDRSASEPESVSPWRHPARRRRALPPEVILSQTWLPPPPPVLGLHVRPRFTGVSGKSSTPVEPCVASGRVDLAARFPPDQRSRWSSRRPLGRPLPMPLHNAKAGASYPAARWYPMRARRARSRPAARRRRRSAGPRSRAVSTGPRAPHAAAPPSLTVLAGSW